MTSMDESREQVALGVDDEWRSQIWKRAYGAEGRDDLIELYGDWAKRYDDDLAAVGFFGHQSTARTLVDNLDVATGAASVLDAGAGTGLGGVALAELGVVDITGIDLSPEMLEQAERKGVYRELAPADIGLPLDRYAADTFDAAVLVGVFSYGQAPAHALDEVLRVLRPGATIAFTMRTDFYENDAMGVRSKIEALERDGEWEPLELSDPEPYLPGKDPDAMFRVWCYRVLDAKNPPLDEAFASAVKDAFGGGGRVRRLDHRWMWNSRGTRLFEHFSAAPEYYLPAAEREILGGQADEMIGDEDLIVELGCGDAPKITYLLDAIDRARDLSSVTYVPIDLSAGGVDVVSRHVDAIYHDRVEVERHVGAFEDELPELGDRGPKLLVFLGGSIGNFETMEETVTFMELVSASMGPKDRILLSIDLDKDPEVLRAAYEAGPSNLIYFKNVPRRINDEFGTDIDLDVLYQESTYDPDPPFRGVTSRSVNFKLVTPVEQTVRSERIGLETTLAVGDAVQIGMSRKFRVAEIAALVELAGLRLSRTWTDTRQYYSVNELVKA